MTNRRALPYGIADEVPPRQRRTAPAFVALIAVACTFFAGLGDWKVMNARLGGLPKAIALGTIVCAFLYFIVDADFVNVKKALSYFPVLIVLIAMYTLISMYIWVTDFSTMYSVSRGMEKVFFQVITVVYAVCMCYLFEDRAIDYLFLGMVLTNTGIMLLEMPKYGIANSIITETVGATENVI